MAGDFSNWNAYVERVRAANPIAEVLRARGVKLRPSSRHRLSCCSPFRNEKNPSFHIYLNEERWHDFGHDGGTGGDVFDLVQQLDSHPKFPDAVHALADASGIAWKGGNGEGTKFHPEFEEQQTRHVERRWVEKISTDAALYYHQKMPDPVRGWWRDKYGFTDETIDAQCLGFSDGKLLEHLRDERGYTVKDILKTGLFIRTEGGRIFEVHEKRATAPYPRGGAYPYMISRRIDGVTPDDSWQQAKYKKSLTRRDDRPYVSRHVRNDVFYNEDVAKKHVEVLLIEEGLTDCISTIQCGLPVISPITTRFKDKDVERAVRLAANADRIVVAFDNERKVDQRTGKMINPGMKGAVQTAKAMWDAGYDVRVLVLPLPPGDDEAKTDVNSFIVEHGSEAFLKLVDGARPYPQFLTSQVPADTIPAELDEALGPVYQAIARCKGAERDSYVRLLGDKFGLLRETVLDAVEEFARAAARETARTPALRARQEPRAPRPRPSVPSVPDAGEAPTGTENSGGAPPDGPPGGMGGAGDPPSEPPGYMGAIEGAIYENPSPGYYYTLAFTKKDGEVEKRHSNFVLRPRRIIEFEYGEQFCVDILPVRGRIARNIVLPPRTFNGSREFRRAVQEVRTSCAWSGTDYNVQGVLERLTESHVETFQGVHTLGYVETGNGPRFVAPDLVMGPDGVDTTTKLIYAPPHGQTPAIARRLDLSGMTLPDADVAKIAARVLPNLFELNEPAVIVPSVAWFCAAAVAPAIRKVLGHFPILWVWGMFGGGKTSLVRDVLWPMLSGVNGEAFSCSDTPFAMMNKLASTGSIVIIMDEHRDLIARGHAQYNRMMRRLFSGEEEQRGRPDLRVNRYPLRAPVVTIGESMPTDPAIMERLVCVAPYKRAITPERTLAFNRIVAEPLSILGGHFQRFVLSLDIRDLINSAQAILKALLLPMLKEKPSPRVRDNLLVVVLGDLLHQKWCERLGVIIPDRPALKTAFVQTADNILSAEDGGGIKDACDQFVEMCSTNAGRGLLQENVHYAKMSGDILCLHLASCFDVCQEQMRRAGVAAGAAMALSAIRRAMREKEADTEGYVLDRRRAVRFDGRQVRCVAIDVSKIPDHLSVDEFPHTEVRAHGGIRKPWLS